MKSISLISLLLVLFVLSASAQKSDIQLTFTAVDNDTPMMLDSIRVLNRTHGGDTVLHWPDTILVLSYQNQPEAKTGEDLFQVFKCYPNPVKYSTTISIYVPKNNRVNILVSDINGKSVISTWYHLEKGYHSFSFTPGSADLYFFTAQYIWESYSVKILHPFTGINTAASLQYTGHHINEKLLEMISPDQVFSFRPGDELLLTGYNGSQNTDIPDEPDDDRIYIFEFSGKKP
ncbi:MAG: hypothetical protein K0B08_04790 [Bacteroidales bacterium]|nr:hypothetical protein [Bacteroidales bacterium]